MFIDENMSDEIRLNLDFYDILEYSSAALEYLRTENNAMDKDEIIMYLSCIPEIIQEIREILKRKEKKSHE